jgi:hypothetical protein
VGNVEIAQLVLEYLKALLWPGIVLTAVFLFLKQLRELLANIGKAVHRLKKVTAPGTSLELSEFVATLSEEVEVAVEPAPSGNDAPTDTEETGDESLDDLTAGKIMRIWREIETSTRELADRLGGAYRPATRFSEELKALTGEGIIPADVARSLLDARSVRNRIAHGAAGISLGTVNDYLRTISRLNTYLKLAIIVEQ